jgi:hypothetical protein
MIDKRKECEEMLDEQLEELNAQIGLFRSSADKGAMYGSREHLPRGADRPRAEGKISFHCTASKFK